MFLIEHILVEVSTAALATGKYGASVFAVFCTAFMSITSDICSRTLLQAKLSIVYCLLNKCLCSEGSPIIIDLILRSGD
jgi:hypothetical protein